MLTFLCLCNCKDSNIQQSINLITLQKGIYFFPGDTTGRPVYLFELRMRNNTDSTVKFLTNNCSPCSNLIFDSQEIITIENECPASRLTTVQLFPKQEFSFLYIVTYKKICPDKLKIGWVFLTEEITSSDNFLKALSESKEKFKNIIWAPEIDFDHPTLIPTYKIK
jgi:hypothetical protein